MASATFVFIFDVVAVILGFLLINSHHFVHHHPMLTSEFFRSAETGDQIFRFALVADRDHHTRDKEKLVWSTHLAFGQLTVHSDGSYHIYLDSAAENIHFQSNFAKKNRSLELSDLSWFQNKLYTACDYTGLVYEIDPQRRELIPRHFLIDGPGDGYSSTKPFKSEWMTVKEDSLYIGSIGKEWVENNIALHNHPNYVKIIGANNVVRAEDWTDTYELIRQKSGTLFPGYMIQEGVAWDSVRRQWIILPRRASTEMYDEVKDEKKGTNLVFLLDEYRKEVTMGRVGEADLEWGFSSVKVIPGTNDCIATRVREIEGKSKTQLVIFSVEKHNLGKIKKINGADSLFIGDEKYEGIEFVPLRFNKSK